MIDTKAGLIGQTIAKRTGADIAIDAAPEGLQKGLSIRFADLNKNGGPLITLRPSGLHRHKVSLGFGSYSGSVVSCIAQANPEQITLARALVRSIDVAATLAFPSSMDVDSWVIDSPAFSMSAERKVRGNRQSDEQIIETCEIVVVPIMAALAELIGYEDKQPATDDEVDGELEGAVAVSTVQRRERNPRNRLLCLLVHGYACATCRTDPRKKYGPNGAVLEIHHLQPLSQIKAPRAYDPRTDLVPLCPTCHRVVHSRRPVPWSPAEVGEMINE
ncbi:HNH endonuclease [Pararhizobium sp. IMCC21322]|uniref:HNH endonuclease n=1 Tax=Pararhizobium sp. IMCC21322 TaxID=3067903 RepID=UPI0027411C6F|nr:HNH endonuclease [Pararhizobium sp. IMCC21322]